MFVRHHKHAGCPLGEFGVIISQALVIFLDPYWILFWITAVPTHTLPTVVQNLLFKLLSFSEFHPFAENSAGVPVGFRSDSWLTNKKWKEWGPGKLPPPTHRFMNEHVF